MCLGCAVAVLLLFEAAYRYQVVDFYAPELRTYNPPAVLDGTGDRPAVLVLGDSFTAGKYSYAAFLRRLMPGFRIVNAGVSGTGIVQANLMAKRRFERFSPRIFVYQIYVGNDLINVRYPIDWHTQSVARNVYGLVSDRLRSLYFANYRLAQLWYSLSEPSPPDTVVHVDEAPFSVERYSPIQKRYLAAEPDVIEAQVMLHGGRKRDFAVLADGLRRLLRRCRPQACRAYVLVIPHAAQVHPRYRDDMEALGARFSDPDALSHDPYPFLTAVGRVVSQLPNAQLLDPLPLLQAREQAGHRMYFNNDGHLNLEGQQQMAHYLCAKLDRCR